MSDKPLPLPPGFEWKEFDPMDDVQAQEFCDFLDKNYVTDEHGNFLVGYPIAKMRWALCPPGYDKDFFTIVRSTTNGKIMATGVGVPKKIVING